MIQTKKIEIPRDRKTYVHGILRGKFHGEVDQGKNLSDREQFYDIQVYEAEIEILEFRKASQVPFDAFESEEFVMKLPDPITCSWQEPNGSWEYYELNLVDAKVPSPKLFNTTKEGDLTFGEIEGAVFAYIKDEIRIHREVVIEQSDSTEDEQAEPKRRTLREIVKGTKDFLFSLLAIFFLVFLVIGILSTLGEEGFWGLLLFLGFIGVLIFLPLILRLVLYLLSFALWLALLGCLVAVLADLSGNGGSASEKVEESYLPPKPVTIPEETAIPETTKKTEYAPKTTEMVDSEREVSSPTSSGCEPNEVFRSPLRWENQRGQLYSGELIIQCEDFVNSRNTRQNYAEETFNKLGYGALYETIIANDAHYLKQVYLFYDSIRIQKQLNTLEFAELVVNSVQQLDYYLMLPAACDPDLYLDNYITRYLAENDHCLANVKYGLYSPVEFAATLRGDCDTRTLFIYSILHKFGYDVVVLGSLRYQHALLGLGLPASGVHKIIDGKRYYFWETTAEGYHLGQVPKEYRNTDYWDVLLN